MEIIDQDLTLGSPNLSNDPLITPFNVCFHPYEMLSDQELRKRVLANFCL